MKPFGLILLLTARIAFANDAFDCEERLINPPPVELGLVLENASGLVRATVNETFEVTRRVDHGSPARWIDPASVDLFETAVADELKAMADSLDVIARHTRVANRAVAERWAVLSGRDPARGGSVRDITRRFLTVARAFNPQELMQILRADEDALLATEVQRALQRIVFGGIAFGARQAIWRFAHPLGWEDPDGPAPIAITTDFEYGMTPPREPGYGLRASKGLMAQLTRELVNNAGRAAYQRHGRIDAMTKPKVRLVPDGDCVALRIEDFGRPESYGRVRGTGLSSTPCGAGIGRLRAHWAATFMGYGLHREIKADGSGSVLIILIPKSHLTRE